MNKKKIKRILEKIVILIPFILMVFLTSTNTNTPEMGKCLVCSILGFICCELLFLSDEREDLEDE